MTRVRVALTAVYGVGDVCGAKRNIEQCHGKAGFQIIGPQHHNRDINRPVTFQNGRQDRKTVFVDALKRVRTDGCPAERTILHDTKSVAQD